MTKADDTITTALGAEQSPGPETIRREQWAADIVNDLLRLAGEGGAA